MAKKQKSPKAAKPTQQTEETTVRFGVRDENGKMQFTKPMPSSEFSRIANSIGSEPSVGTKFFAGQQTRLSFVKFKPRMDKEGKRYLSLTFTVRLAPSDVLSCDSVIQAAYETVEDMEKESPRVEIERVYKGFNVEFFSTPDTERAALKLGCVNLGAIALERSLEHGTLLHFSTEFPYRTDAGHWAVDNWGLTFWTRFKPTNRNLFTDSVDAAGATEGKAKAAAASGNANPTPPLPSAEDLDRTADDQTQRERNRGAED
jgi:hypothetical protein